MGCVVASQCTHTSQPKLYGTSTSKRLLRAMTKLYGKQQRPHNKVAAMDFLWLVSSESELPKVGMMQPTDSGYSGMGRW